MRGKRNRSAASLPNLRIIPAHAGQTQPHQHTDHRTPDHPRACGANGYGVVEHAPPIGSSPRMRGKRLRVRELETAVRIIPAHAGQTQRDQAHHIRPSDHPRACGANEKSTRNMLDQFGSSPRMRGKPGLVWVEFAQTRIIPAHAGQTSSLSCSCTDCSDHPRACGANCFALLSGGLPSGSSPRMRGKRAAAVVLAVRVRIIPAHAGQTRSSTAHARHGTDHPRACGAN